MAGPERGGKVIEISLERKGKVVGVDSKGNRGTKYLIISSVLHEDLVDISNITGFSPSEKVNLTSYREGIMTRLEKESPYFNQFSFTDSCRGYTDISFGCDQV